jgi:hypothetical protein
VPITLSLLLAEDSNRPAIDYLGAGRGSLHPALLLTAFSANLFGAAGILVTHEARHAAWADRIVFLRDGRIVDQSQRAGADALLAGA